MQKKAAFLGNLSRSLTSNQPVWSLLEPGLIHHLIHLMCHFYSLTSLRVNVALSVCSCRRRGSLKGGSHWAHRFPSGGHSACAVTRCRVLEPRAHNKWTERPSCRGSGHVGVSRHGLGPAWRSRHCTAVTASPEMMCGLMATRMNSSGVWRPDRCKARRKEGSHPHYIDAPSPVVTVITQTHGDVPFQKRFIILFVNIELRVEHLLCGVRGQLWQLEIILDSQEKYEKGF